MAGYPIKLLRRVASVADEVNVGAGVVLARQGALAQHFFLIHRGEAEVCRDGGRLGLLGPGTHFGEVTLLDRGPQPVTVRAVTATTLFVIGAQRFVALVNDIAALRRDVEAALVSQAPMVELTRTELRHRSSRTSLRPVPVNSPSAVSVVLRPVAISSRPADSRGPPVRLRAALVAVIASVLAGLLTTAALYHPPIAVIDPGRTIDVSGDITISGVPTHRARGHYLMVTTHAERPNLFGLGLALLHLDHTSLLVDHESPSSPQARRLEQKLRAQFAQSQMAAAAAAARAADMPTSTTGAPPFTVHFRGRDVVGPSAGLVYALAIEDMLSATDRAHGRLIAATGEIDALGNVSEVGDVNEKSEAARKAGAKLLLVPQGNADVASSSSVPIEVVSSLEQALADLATSPTS